MEKNRWKILKALKTWLGNKVTQYNPWNPSEEFMKEFEEYMEKSVRESRRNAADAWKSAVDIFINL